ncbi:hypothetical protein QFZ54_002666 [Sphingomonas faeni]|nr:hypothetical protein [Sphingomonas faeni]
MIGRGNVRHPTLPVILSSTQDPEPKALPCLALDPDFHQDDGGSEARDQAANKSASIEYSTAALAFAAALRPIASGTIWSR